MPPEQISELVEKTPAVLMLESAFELVDQREGHALQNFFLAELSRIAAERAMLKEQSAIIASQIDQREKALYWRFDKEFQAAVGVNLAEQKGKKRSVDYLQGKAGYRMGKTSLEITDEEAAIAWAMENGCKDALKLRVARKGPFIKVFEADGIIPDGCVVHPTEDKFFPALPTKRLPARALAKGLPEE